MSILSILDNIASNTKRSYKLDVLSQHKDNPLLRRVIKMALDPYLNFYIKKIPKYPPGSGSLSLDEALTKLEYLSNRTVTGNAAIEHLAQILSSVSEDDAVVITRIIGKDLRCGIADATVNAVIENFIPTYPCLLARPYTQKNIANILFPAYSQLKADGVRTNAMVKNGMVTLCSRSGRAIDVLNVLDTDLLQLASLFGDEMFFDGELIVVDSNGKPLNRKTGNGIISKAIKGTISPKETAGIRFQVWDAFPLSEFYAGRSKSKYHDRFGTLETTYANYTSQATALGNTQVRISLIPYRIVNNLAEAETHFQELLSEGYEGIIIKNFVGIWSDDRSEHLVKMKAEKDADLEVIGYNPGTGQFENMVGSLICASSDRKVIVSVSGFSVQMRQWITDNIDSVIGKIITVMYNERISSKGADRSETDSLFLPRFVEFRSDKSVANSSEEIT